MITWKELMVGWGGPRKIPTWKIVPGWLPPTLTLTQTQGEFVGGTIFWGAIFQSWNRMKDVKLCGERVVYWFKFNLPIEYISVRNDFANAKESVKNKSGNFRTLHILLSKKEKSVANTEKETAPPKRVLEILLQSCISFLKSKDW